MASKIIQRIKDTAQELYDLRQLIAEKKASIEAEVKALEANRDLVEEKLTKEMAKNELRSIKVASGDVVTLYKTKSLEIISLAHAIDWAITNRAVSINKLLVKQKIGDGEAPPGFAVVESEAIRITKIIKEDKK